MERVDAAGRALMPGLVNGHNHAQTGLSKGLFDRYNLETYLNAQPGVDRQAHARGQASFGADRRRRDGAQGLHRRLRHVRRVPAAHGGRRRGGGARLLGCRHARRDRADDGRQELLRGDPRPRRGAARAAAQPGAEGEIRTVLRNRLRRSGICSRTGSSTASASSRRSAPRFRTTAPTSSWSRAAISPASSASASRCTSPSRSCRRWWRRRSMARAWSPISTI